MTTRGFSGRRPTSAAAARLPPGQYETHDFPVLSLGPTPDVDLATWTFTLNDGPRPLARWTWDEFESLPRTTLARRHPLRDQVVEIRHRVGGRDVRRPARRRRCHAPPTPYLLAQSHDDYDTNVPVADLVGGRAMIATRYAGAPLAAEHGGPARLLVPHLYFWKSAKWVRGAALHRARRGRLLGVARLSHVRRPVARAALHQRPVTRPLPGAPLRWHDVAIARDRAAHAARRQRVRRRRCSAAHDAGQHVDVRLTAPDGYQRRAQLLDRLGAGRRCRSSLRSSSSTAARCRRTSTTSRRPATAIEVRGPIGGHFVWRPADGGPLLLIGRRLGRRAADGDAARAARRGAPRADAAAVLGAHVGRGDLPRRAARAGGARTTRFASCSRRRAAARTAPATSRAASTPTGCACCSTRGANATRRCTSAARTGSSRR